MSDPTSRLAVGAIVRRATAGASAPADAASAGGQVLLVAEDGPDGEEPVWALPGGVVEPDEPVHDALVRKVRAETGLVEVRVKRLLWVARYELGGATWEAYGFEVLTGVEHPDWIGVAEAIERLSGMWFPPIRDPAVQYLSGRASVATLWTWARLDAPPDVTPTLESLAQPVPDRP